MNMESVIQDLLSRWQSSFSQGNETPTEDLCRDYPELREELARRIQAVRQGAILAEAMQHSESPLTTAESAASRAPPPMPSFPGYELVRQIGRGGMGIVYEARQIRLDRPVALKILAGGIYADDEDRARLRTEAESIARLRHAHVVQVHEIGEFEGVAYLVLEYCPGGSLDNRLKNGPMAIPEVLTLVEALARGVQCAHEKGVIHRDLKPSNVLFGEDGLPKIADFGLARQVDTTQRTVSGVVLGTPGYMAPEQAEGRIREVGPASDVFALGVILYECLTGHRPFAGPRPLDTILRTIREDPVRPRHLRADVPQDLETICLKCLEKDPRNRYPQSSDLADRLKRVQQGQSIPERPRSWMSLTWARVRRQGVLVASLGLAVMGVVTFVVALGLSSRGTNVANNAKTATAPAEEDPGEVLRANGTYSYKGASPLPPSFRYIVGPALPARFPEEEEAFAIETLHTALLQITADPGCDAYRLTIDVRHDIAFAFSEVGLFCNYREGVDQQGLRLASFVSVAYADRGDAIKNVQGKGRAASGFRTRGHVLRGGDPPPYERSGPIGSRSIVPAAQILKSPWRRISLTVTGEGIEVHWRSLDDEQQTTYGLSAAVLNRYFAAWRPDEPILNELPVEYRPRAALGLYLNHGAASFRRLILEPLEVEEKRP